MNIIGSKSVVSATENRPNIDTVLYGSTFVVGRVQRLHKRVRGCIPVELYYSYCRLRSIVYCFLKTRERGILLLPLAYFMHTRMSKSTGPQKRTGARKASGFIFGGKECGRPNTQGTQTRDKNDARQRIGLAKEEVHRLISKHNLFLYHLRLSVENFTGFSNSAVNTRSQENHDIRVCELNSS